MTCRNRIAYPFAAIVGQERMKKALILNAINPLLNGVLIRGEKGTAKSTAVRGLAELLAEIEIVADCRFACDPHDATLMCDSCKNRYFSKELLPCAKRKMQVIELPIGATEDRVLGTLDMQKAIKDGEKHFDAGVLADANRGILYIDEVNLLDDHIVDVLLDSAAMGVNKVEREGISYEHPAHFILVGTMNPEEGELRPQLLDRFGLCVSVEGISDVTQRVDVVQRRLAYEADPETFASVWADEQKSLSTRMLKAINLLPSVHVSDDVHTLVSRIAIGAGVHGHRADITMVKAAMTIAAYNERTDVMEADITEAAQLVLPHRMRRTPFERPELEAETLEELLEKVESDHQASGEDVFTPEHTPSSPSILNDLKGEQMTRSGRRVETASTGEGRYVRSRLPANPDAPKDIALDATVRAAAPHQRGRGSSNLALTIDNADIREKVRRRKVGATILFVVDSSGSMGAKKRMIAAKEAIMALLLDAYKCRDQVGMIVFRGESATTVLPPTSSLDVAKRNLEDLPTGGKTPLAHGLAKALDVANQEKHKDRARTVVIVLVTDGKANVALDRGIPIDDVLRLAGTIRDQQIPMLVIDVEDDLINLGLAIKIAESAGGRYVKLDDITSESVVGAVKAGCPEVAM